MVRLPLRRNWGEALMNQNSLLVRQLDEMYTDVSTAVLSTSKKYVVNGQSPQPSGVINADFSEGDIWVRTDTNTAWVMTSRTDASNATWTQIT